MPFTRKTLGFLRDLRKNNERSWFADHRSDYEKYVREPALEFIDQMGPHLARISACFRAIAKKTGGSLMRIHRDTRFSKDKTPYKTNIGIQFRHELGKDVHAPGFYVHIEPGGCFLGLGIWHPDSSTLKQVRHYICEEPQSWKKSALQGSFARHFELAGDSLKTAPQGIDRNHPLIVDLRRKDFIGVSSIPDEAIVAKDFAESVCKQFRKGSSLMRFLCKALKIPY